MIHTRTKIIAGIAGATLAGSLLCLCMMLYTLNSFRNELYTKAGSVNEALKKEEQLIAMERTIGDTATERAELNSIVLTEDRVVDFLAIIEGIGSDLNLISKTNSLTVIPGKADIEEVSMSVSFEGPEQSVRYALRLLETLPYRSFIEKAALSESGEAGDHWIAVIELRVAKYKNS